MKKYIEVNGKADIQRVNWLLKATNARNTREFMKGIFRKGESLYGTDGHRAHRLTPEGKKEVLVAMFEDKVVYRPISTRRNEWVLRSVADDAYIPTNTDSLFKMKDEKVQRIEGDGMWMVVGRILRALPQLVNYRFIEEALLYWKAKKLINVDVVTSDDAMMPISTRPIAIKFDDDAYKYEAVIMPIKE